MLLKTVFMWKANQCQVAVCISTWDTYSSMSIASWMRILLSSLMPPGKDGAWDFLFLLSFSKLSSVRLTDVRTSDVISKYLYAQTISSRKRKLLGCLSMLQRCYNSIPPCTDLEVPPEFPAVVIEYYQHNLKAFGVPRQEQSCIQQCTKLACIIA